MILCINSNSIKNSPEVQRNVNLEDLLLNHTKYFDSVADALKEGYVPLDFCVSIRSMYSNLVVQSKKEDQFRYYTNMINVQEFPHKGYDLLMYLSSIALMHNVDYKLGFDELMMKHSQFSPIGILKFPDLVNPLMYSHIIISDEGVEELKKYLKEDRELVPIKDIKPEGNLVALLNTLIEVKEEDHNEQK